MTSSGGYYLRRGLAAILAGTTEYPHGRHKNRPAAKPAERKLTPLEQARAREVTVYVPPNKLTGTNNMLVYPKKPRPLDDVLKFIAGATVEQLDHIVAGIIRRRRELEE